MSFAKFLKTNLEKIPIFGVHTAENTEDDNSHRLKLSYDDLINAESELGRTLFGPIPEGHQREFFEHRKNVWIWHESWLDAAGLMKGTTIRYEVRPDGVFKKVPNSKYIRLEGAELNNFRLAVKSYFELIKTKLYY